MRHHTTPSKALRAAALLLLLTAVSGCAGPYYGRGWCYWHPYRCGR